jgi:RNA polymerase-associated protein RTF1
MLEKRKQLSNTGQGPGMTSQLTTTLERSRLQQALTLAQRRQDHTEIAEIQDQLSKLSAADTSVSNSNAGEVVRSAEDELREKLALVNERNRRANLEAVRKAELAESERKRAKRKLEASRLSTPDVGNGSSR